MLHLNNHLFLRIGFILGILALLIQANPQAERLYGKAVELFQAQEYRAAMSSYRQLSQMVPQAVEIQLNIAVCLERMNKLEEAYDYYLDLLSPHRFPNNEKVLISLCRLYQNTGVGDSSYCQTYEEQQNLSQLCTRLEMTCQLDEMLDRSHCFDGVWESNSFHHVYNLGRVQMSAKRVPDAYHSFVKAWDLFVANELQARSSCDHPIRLHVGWMSDFDQVPEIGDHFNGHDVIWTSLSEPDVDRCFANHQQYAYMLDGTPASKWKQFEPLKCLTDLKKCDMQFNSFVFRLEKATIQVPGTIYTECDVYLGSQHIHSHVPIIRPIESLQLASTAAVLFDYKMANYYHWCVEGLSKLLLLKEHVLDKDPTVPLVIPDIDFIKRFVELAGIDMSRVLYFTGEKTDALYTFDTLYYASWDMEDQMYRQCDSFSAFYAPSELVRKSVRLFAGEPLPSYQRNKIIYISRSADASGGARSVGNERYLEKVVSNHVDKEYPDLQFEFVGNLSSYTADEQIALFKQAKMIISPHGAGMANMMWAAPGTIVIEFPLAPNFNSCFQYLARAVGHVYWVHAGIVGCYFASYGDLSKNQITGLLDVMDEAFRVETESSFHNEL